MLSDTENVKITKQMRMNKIVKKCKKEKKKHQNRLAETMRETKML